MPSRGPGSCAQPIERLHAQREHRGMRSAPTPASSCYRLARSPLFVTWTKRRSSSATPQLRGCIGTLEPRRLHTALKDYALTRSVWAGTQWV